MNKYLFILLVIFSQSVFASFLPENDLYLEDDFYRQENTNGMTKEIFDDLIDIFKKYYTPIISKKGASLYISRKWDDPTVNAYALKNGNQWTIRLYGGLARRPEISYDGFVLVMCHEMGHLIGGSPIIPNTYMSNEGQSDYFATSNCLKKILPLINNGNQGDFELPESIKESCQNIYPKEEEYNICLQSNRAGYFAAKLFSAMSDVPPPSFLNPDTNIVKTIFHKHPTPQCRLDTYHAGTINSQRPFCWFKP